MIQKIDEPVEANLMALFEKDPAAFAADKSLCELAQKVFVDPWSQEKFRNASVWGKGFAESTASFHLSLESWLSKKYNLSVSEDERWATDRRSWVGALFYQAKKKRSHAAALAAITLLSLGTDSLNDVMNDGEPYSLKLDFKKKTWNHEFAQRALEELAKLFDGGTDLVKQLEGAAAYRAALEALWQKAKAADSSLEILRAFALLKMAYGECAYDVLAHLKQKFPEGFIF